MKAEVVLSNNIDDNSINKGQVMGYVEYRDAGELVGVVDLLSAGSFVSPKAVKFEDSFKNSAAGYHFKWMLMSITALALSGYALGFIMTRLMQ